MRHRVFAVFSGLGLGQADRSRSAKGGTAQKSGGCGGSLVMRRRSAPSSQTLKARICTTGGVVLAGENQPRDEAYSALAEQDAQEQGERPQECVEPRWIRCYARLRCVGFVYFKVPLVSHGAFPRQSSSRTLRRRILLKFQPQLRNLAYPAEGLAQCRLRHTAPSDSTQD